MSGLDEFAVMEIKEGFTLTQLLILVILSGMCLRLGWVVMNVLLMFVHQIATLISVLMLRGLGIPKKEQKAWVKTHSDTLKEMLR